MYTDMMNQWMNLRGVGERKAVSSKLHLSTLGKASQLGFLLSWNFQRVSLSHFVFKLTYDRTSVNC